MLKKSTLEELHKVIKNFIDNLHLLSEKCPDIFKNEIEKKPITTEDIKTQKKLLDNIHNFFSLVERINLALKEGNAEKLRIYLLEYFFAIENIFSANEKVGLAYEVAHQGGKPVEGRYLEAHHALANMSNKIKEHMQLDRHLKDELGNASKLADLINKINKDLRSLVGVKTAILRGESVIHFEKVVSMLKKNHVELTVKKISCN